MELIAFKSSTLRLLFQPHHFCTIANGNVRVGFGWCETPHCVYKHRKLDAYSAARYTQTHKNNRKH